MTIKTFLILAFVLMAYVSTYGQKNWLIGKWTCGGSLKHLYKFPEKANAFEKEGCGNNWYFKRNGKVIWRSTDSNGKPLGHGYSNSKGKWELNATNDTLFIYNGQNKSKIRYAIYKYNEKEFAMLRVMSHDEVRRGNLYIKE